MKRSRAGKKRKRQPVEQQLREDADEDILGRSDDDADDDEDNHARKRRREESESETVDPFVDETPDEKRLRLAEDYLKRLGAPEAGDIDDEFSEEEPEFEEDVPRSKLHAELAERLRKQLKESSVSFQRPFADRIAGLELAALDCCYLRNAHKQTLTCLALSADDRTIFSGSKDGTIVKYDVETGKKLFKFHANRANKSDTMQANGGLAAAPSSTPSSGKGHVLCVATSSDGKYVASGGTDKVVRVWDAHNHQPVETFKGHRGAITCLAFREGTHELFSGSADRTLKLWNLDEGAYVETLFGHTAEVLAVDCMARERAVSVGRDRTARVWKVVEESQLIFRNGHATSVDAVTMLHEEAFLTGGQDGSLALWSIKKKRPLATYASGHGCRPGPPEPCDAEPYWICSLAACRRTDLCASGSSSGFVQLWKTEKFRKLAPVAKLPLAGFVNGLAFATSGRFLVAAVGQEHRLGRWERCPAAKNEVVLCPLGMEPAE